MKLPFELLNPAALWLAALLGPLVVLYILKVKRKRRRVASTWLWLSAQRDLMARSPFKRLVVQLPLLLQALALIILALAAAAPATRSRGVSGDHVAIIVDTSASMGAKDPPTGQTRIRLAQAAALQLISSLHPDADAMILDAGRDARIALPPDRDVRRLRTAVERLAVREVEGDLGAAVALAVSRLSQSPGKRSIVVITDGNLAQPAALESAAADIEVVKVGTPIDNAAIVRVDVRSGTDPVLGKEQVQAFLLVASYGQKPRELYVTMREDNASDVLGSRRIVIRPGERQPVLLTFSPTAGDYGRGLVFELSPKDDLPVDDVAYGRIPPGQKLEVVVAAPKEPSPWLLLALTADENAEVHSGTVAEVLGSSLVGRDAFVVVDGACPPHLPGGDLLIVNPPGGECYGAVVGRQLEKPFITSWSNSDIRLRFLTLDGVHLLKARELSPESKRQRLIVTDQGAIAADISQSSRSATLLGFDVGESNWPYKASFVLFIRNLMEQARVHRSTSLSGPALAGNPLRATVSANVREVLVESPGSDEAQRFPAKNGLAVVPEVQRLGLYRIRWEKPEPGSFVVPVNLVSSAESDLTDKPLIKSRGAAQQVVAAATIPETHRSYGWLLALAALGFILFDIWYLTRRPRTVRLATAQKPRLPERRTR